MTYFPRQEGKFVEWSGNVIAVSKANITEWGLDPVQVSGLETEHGVYKALYEKCQTSSYTKLEMKAKIEKRSAFEKHLEVFIRNNLQNNDRMTDQGRAALQIPIHDTTPTPHPAPDTIPEVEVQTPAPRTLRIRFRAENAKRWSKPPHVHGLECLWVITDTAPAKIGELLHSSFATRSPLEMTFDEDQRGKRLWFAVRWENGTVQKGKWSDIFSAVIP
jgi:hypothetical protein